jgi:beta-lactam-binding protein with PASTA domain
MKGKIRQSFWFHFLIVLSLCLILYMSFFATLHWVTKHGEELVIPDVRGKDINTAIAELKRMHFEVYVDSTYEPALKPLRVLKQVPDTGSVVKEGRTVFLTVNMVTPPHVPMPNLVNLSYRSAEMLLHNNKLLVGDTSHVPDIAAGAVKEQLYKGREIRPGEMITQGSKISLVIGDGLGNTEFDVPDVTGMTVDEAMTVINQYGLQPIIVANDGMSEINDTASATIVDQEPQAMNSAGMPNRIKEGNFIDLKIEQNPSREEIHTNNTNAPAGVNNGNKTEKPK